MYFRFFVLLCFMALNVNAQKTCSSQEIQEVLRNSDFEYRLGDLKKEVTPKEYTKLTSFEYHANKKGEVIKYPLSEDYSKGKNLLKQGKPKEARAELIKVLGQFPNHAAAMSLMAKAYAKEGSTAEAIQWFEKAITANYSDFSAHKGLADLYQQKGNTANAIEEITTAHILNRNDQLIYSTMKKLFTQKGINLGNWFFSPKLEMSRKEGKVLDIKFGMAWMGYALPKAIRTFEPGHGVDVKDYKIMLANEKEGLMAMLPAGMRDTRVIQTPEFKYLKKSIGDQTLEEFVYYEIILREHPEVAYQLPQKSIEKIRNYLIKGLRGN